MNSMNFIKLKLKYVKLLSNVFVIVLAVSTI